MRGALRDPFDFAQGDDITYKRCCTALTNIVVSSGEYARCIATANDIFSGEKVADGKYVNGAEREPAPVLLKTSPKNEKVCITNYGKIKFQKKE